MMTVEAAADYARVAHEGQTDKAGLPYFSSHVLDVHRRVVLAGGDEDQQVAALLHDVLEDTAITAADLERAGVSPEALRLTLLLTHVPHEDRAAPELDGLDAPDPPA